MQTRLLIAVLIAIGGVSLGSREVAASIPAADHGAVAAQEAFARLLRERRPGEASRYLAWLDVDHQTVSPELRAQHALLSCRPRAAWDAIQAIASPQKKALFEAVLSALVSVPRPALSGASSLPNGRAPAVIAPALNLPVVKMPISDGEIWRDEWNEIGASGSECRQMPLAEAAARPRLQARARELFESLSVDSYLADFTVVALALDVGAKVPEATRLLDRFRDLHENAYYRRLVLLQTDFAQAARPVGAAGTSELTPLRLARFDGEAHALKIPVLLEGRAP